LLLIYTFQFRSAFLYQACIECRPRSASHAHSVHRLARHRHCFCHRQPCGFNNSNDIVKEASASGGLCPSRPLTSALPLDPAGALPTPDPCCAPPTLETNRRLWLALNIGVDSGGTVTPMLKPLQRSSAEWGPINLGYTLIVHAFGYSSAGSEPIWMKFGAL